MNPGISILIRTFNSAGTLDEVLARLALQSGDEVIVVDSGSTDATLEIARKHHARIITAKKPFNYSKSLNLGFRVANNPWVLVISSHCMPLSKNLIQAFRDVAGAFPDNVAVAYGECLLVENLESPAQPVWYVDKNAPQSQSRQAFGGNGLALYRHACWQMQPFDETLPTAEDLAWFLQAMAGGAVAAHVPSAQVLYRNQGSISHMFRKGWLESQMAILLTGSQGMNLWKLGINWGSLMKKWMTGKIPASTLLRHGAHALGAYLSPKFFHR